MIAFTTCLADGYPSNFSAVKERGSVECDKIGIYTLSVCQPVANYSYIQMTDQITPVYAVQDLQTTSEVDLFVLH